MSKDSKFYVRVTSVTTLYGREDHWRHATLIGMLLLEAYYSYRTLSRWFPLLLAEHKVMQFHDTKNIRVRATEELLVERKGIEALLPRDKV